MRLNRSILLFFSAALIGVIACTTSAKAQGIVTAVLSGDEAKVREYLRQDCSLAGTNPDFVIGQHWGNLACLAAFEGNTKIIEDLVNCGLSPDQRSTSGSTPLILAATFGHTAAVRTLLALGANPHASDRDGWTALHGAAAGGFLDCVNLLLKADADKDARDNSGLTPEDWAEKGDYTEVEIALKRFIPPKTPQQLADSLGAEAYKITSEEAPLGHEALEHAKKLLLRSLSMSETANAYARLSLVDELAHDTDAAIRDGSKAWDLLTQQGMYNDNSLRFRLVKLCEAEGIDSMVEFYAGGNHAELAHYFKRKGQLQKALSYYGKPTGSDSESRSEQYDIGNCYFTLGKEHEALIWFELAATRPTESFKYPERELVVWHVKAIDSLEEIHAFDSVYSYLDLIERHVTGAGVDTAKIRYEAILHNLKDCVGGYTIDSVWQGQKLIAALQQYKADDNPAEVKRAETNYYEKIGELAFHQGYYRMAKTSFLEGLELAPNDKNLEEGIDGVNGLTKSPILAGLLAVMLPGAGQVYAGHPGGILGGACVIGLAIGTVATYDNFKQVKRQYINGPILNSDLDASLSSAKKWTYALGIIATLAYCGTIFSAVDDANDFNENLLSQEPGFDFGYSRSTGVMINMSYAF